MNNLNVNVAQVFVNKDGDYGNPVGIVLDEEQKLNEETRQQIATKLNFSETVFIDSLRKVPSVSIFNPQHKVKFAGHAVLGTAYYIRSVLKKDIGSIKCGNELVNIKEDGEILYITAPLSIMPSWNFEELNSYGEVEKMTKKEGLEKKHAVIWAWIDKSKGLIRARTFAPDWGIPEDQANGSGSMLLATKLNREIEILHGKGSVIYAKPIDSKTAEVGGRVVASKKTQS